MANYNNLKTIIQAFINANGNQAITGDIMQQTLVAIVDALGKGYQFMGIATPATDPGTTDQKVFYIANGKGVYTNFGGLNVGEDGLVLLVYSETWTKLLVTNLADLADGSVTTPKIADSAVTENKLASQSVSSKKIKDATIGASKLGVNSVTTSKIADKAVTFEKLDDNSVTTSKIEDNAVTKEKIEDEAVSSPKLTKGARKPIILTSDTTEVDEETYQKLLSDDVDVVLKIDTGNLCLLTSKINRGGLLKLLFTCLSVEGLKATDVWIYGYKVSITGSGPHNCSVTRYIGNNLYSLLALSNCLTISAFAPVLKGIDLTGTDAERKAKLAAYKANLQALGISLTNGCCIPVTYKAVYAGNISLINGDWYGLLVKSTNNLADNINIKLSADGTITEGNSVQ